RIAQASHLRGVSLLQVTGERPGADLVRISRPEQKSLRRCFRASQRDRSTSLAEAQVVEAGVLDPLAVGFGATESDQDADVRRRASERHEDTGWFRARAVRLHLPPSGSFPA